MIGRVVHIFTFQIILQICNMSSEIDSSSGSDSESAFLPNRLHTADYEDTDYDPYRSDYPAV